MREERWKPKKKVRMSWTDTRTLGGPHTTPPISTSPGIKGRAGIKFPQTLLRIMAIV